MKILLFYIKVRMRKHIVCCDGKRGLIIGKKVPLNRYPDLTVTETVVMVIFMVSHARPQSGRVTELSFIMTSKQHSQHILALEY